MIVDGDWRSDACNSDRLSGPGLLVRGPAARFVDGGPHQAAEERVLYPVGYADPRANLLVEGMLAEHQMIQRLVTEVADAVDAVYAAATAHALRHVFEAQIVKDNDLLLPMLARSPHVSLADIAAEPRSLAGVTG